MMFNIFLDTDVIIDYFTDRQPFVNSSSRLFELNELNKLKIHISAVSVSNIYYVARKYLGHEKTLDVVEILLETVEILETGKNEIKMALRQGFSDFEDAIQYSTALNIEGVDAIITRNIKDYSKSQVAVFTPDNFLALNNFQPKYLSVWFEQLTGFPEENPDQVRKNLEVSGPKLRSLVNGAEYTFGRLEVPTLADLRKQVPLFENPQQPLQISETVGDVQALHAEPENEGAMFQAASQFNLLEMVNPEVTPERGIGIYQYDRTQGPACAIACGAGTIYRNYFVEINGQKGQSADHQVDCLEEIAKALDNDKRQLWQMKNGYALPSREGLQHVANHIQSLSAEAYDELKSRLKIGLQWNTEVTLNNSGQLVSQAYCSALPIAYSQIDAHLWEPFARLILEATYEATFLAALINYADTGNPRLFLTLVGGGAFGNPSVWIFDAIRQSVRKFARTPLEMRIVSYGRSNAEVRAFLEKLPR